MRICYCTYMCFFLTKVCFYYKTNDFIEFEPNFLQNKYVSYGVNATLIFGKTCPYLCNLSSAPTWLLHVRTYIPDIRETPLQSIPHNPE